LVEAVRGNGGEGVNLAVGAELAGVGGNENLLVGNLGVPNGAGRLVSHEVHRNVLAAVGDLEVDGDFRTGLGGSTEIVDDFAINLHHH